MSERPRITPQPGPQTVFASSDADIAIYGGAAGGGKSWALLFEAARGVHVPGYAAILFRKHLTNITGPGGLYDASRMLYPLRGGRAKGSPKPEWLFPGGARIGFDHLADEGSEEMHQGAEYAFIGFDELTQMSERKFWYLTSRSRSTCGVKPYIRATCNPDPDSFVRRLIDWWIDADGYAIQSRSGVLRWFVRDGDDLEWGSSSEELAARFPQVDAMGNRIYIPRSLTFVPASLDDNPALLSADPGYRAALMALPRVDRERLLGGNWNARAAAGMYFQRAWFPVIDEPPPHELVVTARAWDKAASEATPTRPDPDWTAGAKVSRMRDGRICIHHIARLRGRPAEVERTMLNIAAQDGRGVVVGVAQDPGQAGLVDVERMMAVLLGYPIEVVRATRDKETIARTWSSQAEQGRVVLVRGPWNDAFLSEAEAFPDGRHDDQIDSVGLAIQVLTSAQPSVYEYQAAPTRAALRDDEDRGRASMRGRAGLF